MRTAQTGNLGRSTGTVSAIGSVINCRSHWTAMLQTDCLLADKKRLFNGVENDNKFCTCHCCKHTSKMHSDCDECPLAGFAWETHCCFGVSHYRDWARHLDADDTGPVVPRKIAAQRLIFSCDRYLKVQGPKPRAHAA